MRKTANIFLKVGMILSIVCIALFVVCALAFFVMAPFSARFVELAAESGASSSAGTAMSAAMLVGIFVGSGVAMLFCIPLYAVCIVLARKARSEGSKGLYLANIILGAISGSEFNLAGGILGLISVAKENRAAKESSLK